MEITVCQSHELSDLAARWTELESRADGGFFLSWRWIGTWLSTTGAKPLLVVASEKNVTVALGLLTASRKRRHFISVNQLCLHETGMADFDALMIEHNNFLIARHAPSGSVTEILRRLQSIATPWDEIVFGGVSPNLVSAAQAAGLRVETDRSSSNYCVDLSHQAATGRWEDTLSANQRAQIRQSRAFAERIGPLKLEQAVDTSQALEFFENMVDLHTLYWQKRNRPGAFATEFSRGFHRQLISSRDGEAKIELLRFCAGSEALGYLYNFRYADRVCNYQSGFAYSGDNRHRPGLIAHIMAIEQARNQGLRIYDFLAGDARYKARLGQLMGTILWCRGQRDRPGLKAERAARRIYRTLRSLRSGSS